MVRDDGTAAVASLHGISQFDDIWEGDAASQFRSTLNRLIEALDKLVASYATAGTAVRVYAEQLASAKGLADNAAFKADEALQDREWAINAIADAKQAKAGAAADLDAAGEDLARAQREDLALVAAGTQFAGVAAPVVEAQSRQSTAQIDLASARTTLSRAESAQEDADTRVAGAKSLADQAQELLEGAGRTLKEALRAATEEGVRNKGLLEQAWDATGGKIVTATADAAHWLSDVENLKKLSSVLGTIGKWLGYFQLILFWVPILGPALAIASLAVAGMKFAIDGYLFAKGELSWQEFAMSGAGLVLAGVGAKGAVTSLKGAMSVKAVAGSSTTVSTQVGDDMVTTVTREAGAGVGARFSGEGVSFFTTRVAGGSTLTTVATGPAGTRVLHSAGPRFVGTSSDVVFEPMQLARAGLKEVALNDAQDFVGGRMLGEDPNYLIDDLLKTPFTPPGIAQKNLLEAAK